MGGGRQERIEGKYKSTQTSPKGQDQNLLTCHLWPLPCLFSLWASPVVVTLQLGKPPSLSKTLESYGQSEEAVST